MVRNEEVIGYIEAKWPPTWERMDPVAGDWLNDGRLGFWVLVRLKGTSYDRPYVATLRDRDHDWPTSQYYSCLGEAIDWLRKEGVEM